MAIRVALHHKTEYHYVETASAASARPLGSYERNDAR